MQIAIHLGVHCTDDDRVLKTLLNNKGVLSKECISIPGPGRYRNQLMKVVQKLKGAEASADTCDMLLDEIVDDDTTTRVVLTHDHFICVPGRIFDNGVLYDKAGYKPMWLRNTFPGAEIEFFLSIRNPATFIPAAFRHPAQKTENFATFMNGVDVYDIHWSDVIIAIKESNPDCPITVWCNEDTPLIWPEIIREISGHNSSKRLKGGFDVLATIMQKEGMRRLRTYLGTNPPQNENQRRRILAAFLDKYLIEDAVEEVLDVPGWTDELVEALTQTYEDDLLEIEKIPGVTFIAP
jgi:hypothetical protein